jgi:hypothetical protein
MREHKSTGLGKPQDIQPSRITQSDANFAPLHSRCVALSSLTTGDLITINTRNTCYQIRVVDAAAGRALITGGLLFQHRTDVEVIGASDDAGVRKGWVIVCLQLELSKSRGPVLTSTVLTLSVEAGTAADLSASST